MQRIKPQICCAPLERRFNTIAERNRFEKYDFYLSKYPVCYQNDVYMDYFTSFYEKTVPRLSKEANEKFYQGVILGSPTMIFNGLASEYTLKNPRIREFVMIQALSEMYYSKEYPKTNIEVVLDSLSKNSLFEEHEKIAQNVLYRLTDLVPGSKAPNFVLQSEDTTQTLFSFSGKHLYIHFMDPKNKDNIQELEVMEEMYSKYSPYVEFLTLYKESESIAKSARKSMEKTSWPIYGLETDHAIFDKYHVTSYSQYVFLDAAGYIVASPALTPTPDGEYETIDRTFYYLKQAIDRQDK